MPQSRMLRLMFILYCAEIGVFLVVAPWSPVWERYVALLPFPAAHRVASHALCRGAVSGFGLVHLVWGAHDVLAWISGRWKRESMGA